MPDLLAGRIDYLCDPIQTALPGIQQKTVKALATLSRDRAALLSAVPTAHEQGVANFDASIWFALFFPKNTPRRLSFGSTACSACARQQERSRAA